MEPLTLGEDSTGVLDVILTSDEKGSKYVCAVANKHPDKAVPLTVDFKGTGLKAPKKVSAKVLAGNSALDYNDIGDEHVKPFETTIPVKDGTVSIPAHSVTFLFFE
jgi:alpha-L-arabinofuranosidase